jgi:3-oxoadipate enol-lactonase
MTVPELRATAPHGADGAPLIVLGPSLGTSTLLWDGAAALLGASFRVTAWDLPGHGQSPAAREPFTVAELADAVVRLLDALGEQRVYYAGVSLGGAVGLELALRHPGRLIALADVCSAAKFGSAQAWHERAAQVRAQGTAALVVQSAQRWFAPGSIERHPVVSGRLLHALRDADDESYALCCEALAGFDVRDRLREIRVPVRVLWGEHDPVISREAALEVADGVRDGALVPIPDAAHLAPAEQPEVVAEAVAELAAGVAA